MENVNISTHHFEDDGTIPNSPLPLVVYAGAFEPFVTAGEIESRFESNQWSGTWRNGVYPYHHYHTEAHEVLGCYRGNATVLFGGEQGTEIEISAGDVVVLPAGVGHKRIKSSPLFAVVGGYPAGQSVDMCYGHPEEERPGADRKIAAVPLPTQDPVSGMEGPLLKHWRIH